MTTVQHFLYKELDLAYRTWGDDANPALLLLHGFTGTSLGWKELAQDWASNFWVVAPDLPGHGASRTPSAPADLSVANTAKALCHLMASVSSRPFSLLGYSLGGRIGLHMLHEVPHLVRCAILESTSPGIQDPAERAARRRQDMGLADKIEAEGLDWFISYWESLPLFASQSTLVEPLRQRLRQERHTQTAWGQAQSLRGAGTGTQDSLWSLLPNISIPILLVTGSEDAKYQDIARAMHAVLPDSQWVSVDDAGHNVHLERSHEFAEIVSQFLSQ